MFISLRETSSNNNDHLWKHFISSELWVLSVARGLLDRIMEERFVANTVAHHQGAIEMFHNNVADRSVHVQIIGRLKYLY